MCGFCNVCVFVCQDFEMSVCMCCICNGWVCVWVF